MAIGPGALVAGPADAALTAAGNAVTTPTYYVQNPVIGAASNLTPESAVVSGVIDTGGDPEALLPVPAAGLTWDGSIAIAGGVQWSDNETGNYVPLSGIPTDGSSANVSVTVTDASANPSAPVISAVSNAGADNFSTVTFEYDPVTDYVKSGDQPGSATQFSEGVNVPTTTGLSSVATTIGAFGRAAQDNTTNSPLKPSTDYYYWLVQQPGGTDAATSVNVAQWAAQPSNPTDVCLPNVAIAKDKTLAAYSASKNITVDGTTAAQLEGPCVYYYGSNVNYQSPNGEFTTPALGRLDISRSGKVSGRKATITVTNTSAYKASGSLELDSTYGNELASGNFSVGPKGTKKVTLKLTSTGVTAAKQGKKALLTLTSNWDQATPTRSIKLIEPKATASHAQKKSKHRK